MIIPITFDGPKLKIERAKKHINDLDECLLSFSKTDYYRLWVDKDPHTGHNVLQFKITETLPVETALIIGDALHNLKSALDCALNDIVYWKFAFRDDFTKFPFRDSRNDLVKAIKGGLIYKASEQICDLIVGTIKPYKGGNDALCALHDLNILDKHRLLLPCVMITRIDGICAEDDTGTMYRDLSLVVDETTTLRAIATFSNLKITNKGKAAFSVKFDKGLPFDSQPVISTLHQFTDLVSGIIGAFENTLR